MISSVEQDVNKKVLPPRIQYIISWSVLFLFGLAFGFRDYKVGTDTKTYIGIFEEYATYDFGVELVFKGLVGLTRIFTNSRGFLIVMAFIYVLLLGTVIRQKTFNENRLLLLLTFVTLFFFKNFGFNAMRQGIASMLILLAINSWEKDKKLYAFLFSVIAVGIHTSSLLIILLYLAVKKVRSIKSLLAVYIIAALISITGNGIRSLSNLVPEVAMSDRRAAYFVLEMSYETGFRIDFFAFNTLFLIVALAIKRYMLNDNSEYAIAYTRWLKYFALSSSLFFLSFDMPFSDRWGLLSWISIPYLLEPLASKKNSYKISTLYTLIMGALFIVFEIFLI
ncbi:EpsG family protein [Parapedobacter sp. DT-150]|uniref:EpsG family protein n=1 Tax=Parapedobacter sp. DT-150 TaxID=3396162 RepID=UPI003F1D4E94